MYASGAARPLSCELLVWVGGCTRTSRCQSWGWDEAELVPVMENAHRLSSTRLVHGHTAMWCVLPTSRIYGDTSRWRKKRK
jgi:hypothetical protein